MTLHQTHPAATAPTLTEQHERRLLDALAPLDLTDRDRQLVRWLAVWDQPTVAALVDVLDRLAASPPAPQGRALRNSRGRACFVTESAESTCRAWNDAHDCRLSADHPGDHRCAGCGDTWNRGPWDHDADEWEHERPNLAERCLARAETTGVGR